MQIADLADAPGHRNVVADRIWNEWWRPYGEPLSAVEAALEEVIAADGFPSFTLVAIEGDGFLGTATAIKTDIAARPDLGPCIAALWVDESARGRGIGAALMAAACQRLAASGFREAFLGAKPHLRGYYSRYGWILVESDVGDDRLDVFRHALP